LSISIGHNEGPPPGLFTPGHSQALSERSDFFLPIPVRSARNHFKKASRREPNKHREHEGASFRAKTSSVHIGRIASFSDARWTKYWLATIILSICELRKHKCSRERVRSRRNRRAAANNAFPAVLIALFAPGFTHKPSTGPNNLADLSGVIAVATIQ
jgi:hypothetical protein